MITTRGSVPFPTDADAGPVEQFATDLAIFAQSLSMETMRLNTTVVGGSAPWTGDAADRFRLAMLRRSRWMSNVALELRSAVPALRTLAATIRATTAGYSSAARIEQAARPELPYSAVVLNSALGAQADAATQLQAAGATCAHSLQQVTQAVASAQYADLFGGGVLRSLLAAQPGPVVRAYTPEMIAADREAERYRQFLNRWEQTSNGVSGTLDTIDGAVKGLERGVTDPRWHRRINMANGTSYTRWTPASHGSSLGMTHQQAVGLSRSLSTGTRALPVVGAAMAGGSQYLEDRVNPNLTIDQVGNRVRAATVIEGGGAWAGGAAGAALGAQGGAAVGVFFGGVGAVPGAVIGGALGGLVGGVAGSGAGRWIKKQVFEWNPYGTFR